VENSSSAVDFHSNNEGMQWRQGRVSRYLGRKFQLHQLFSDGRHVLKTNKGFPFFELGWQVRYIDVRVVTGSDPARV
jgi:hypothetical protein